MRTSERLLGLPPGPRGRWLVGNLQDFETDRLQFVLDMRDRFGALSSFDADTAIVSDWQLADKVLRDPTGAFEITENFLGQRLAPEELPDLLQSRMLLNPGLRQRQVLRVLPHVRAVTRSALGRSSAPDEGQGLDVDGLELAESVVARVVGHHFFGEDGEAIASGVADLLDALERVIGNVFALPPGWGSKSQRRVTAAHRDLHRTVTRLVEQRAASALTPDLAASIVHAGAQRYDSNRLADLIIGALLAAQRVPAAAAGWTLHLVATDPGLQDRLLCEAEQMADDSHENHPKAPTAYPLALATVLEALRLYPPTWLLSRTALRPVTLGGYHFRPGHRFLISPYVLHRDEASYPDASNFDPSRWLAGSPPKGVYLPFGRGRHRCPGADLSTTCLIGLLLTVVQRGRISNAAPVRHSARTSLKPQGLRLRLEPRTLAVDRRSSGGALSA